jgi:type VI secretion system VasD/TssJ family lipoprotein
VVVVQTPGPPPPPAYAVQGLRMRIKADPDLNQQEDQPHALLVVVYQLSATNAFNQLAKDSTGLQALLKGGRFDASVCSVDRWFLQPGQELQLPLDRAQYAQWLGVAAGYDGLAPGATTRLVELPDPAQVTPGTWPVLELLLGRDAIRNAVLLKPAKPR